MFDWRTLLITMTLSACAFAADPNPEQPESQKSTPKSISDVERDYAAALVAAEEQLRQAQLRAVQQRLAALKALRSAAMQTENADLVVQVQNHITAAEQETAGERKIDVNRSKKTHRIRVSAFIDGSDVIIFRPGEALWQHKHWGLPTDVSINGLKWDMKTDPRLPTKMASSVVPERLNMQSARIVDRRGRDTIALEIDENEVKLFLADSPNGADRYEVTVEFSAATPR
jgi:hypothetical protein